MVEGSAVVNALHADQPAQPQPITISVGSTTDEITTLSFQSMGIAASPQTISFTAFSNIDKLKQQIADQEAILSRANETQGDEALLSAADRISARNQRASNESIKLGVLNNYLAQLQAPKVTQPQVNTSSANPELALDNPQQQNTAPIIVNLPQTAEGFFGTSTPKESNSGMIILAGIVLFFIGVVLH